MCSAKYCEVLAMEVEVERKGRHKERIIREKKGLDSSK